MAHFYRTAFKKKVKKILYITGIVLVAVAIALVIYTLISTGMKRSETELANRIETELNPLENELFFLENDLDNIKRAYERTKLGNGSVIILFNKPDVRVFTEAYPILKEYDCKGVIAVSSTAFPGLKGCMSEAQFGELMAEGWELALTWKPGSSDPFGDLEYLQAGVNKYTGKVCTTVFFPLGSFTKDYNDKLKSMGMQTAIHHGEDKLPIGVKEGSSDEVWNVGAYQWRTVAAIKSHDDLATNAKCAVYEIGFNTNIRTLDFSEEQFSSMIRVINEYKNDVLKIVGINGAREIFIDKNFQYNMTPAEYEAEINRLQKLVDDKRAEVLAKEAELKDLKK